jgi:hypothetical protein
MKTKLTLLVTLCGLAPAAFAATPDGGSVLPFPPTLSASKAGPTLQESVHQRRVEPDCLGAAMAGKTGLVVGYLHNQFIHVPIELLATRKKSMDPAGFAWSAVLAAIGQPERFE